MSILRITMLVLSGVIFLTGCGSNAEAASKEAATHHKYAENIESLDSSPKSIEITAVAAVDLEPVAEGMDAEEFLNGDIHWEWSKSYHEKIAYSEKNQDGMDQYYGAILKELLCDKRDENAVCSPLNIYVALSMLAEASDGNTRAQILRALQAENIEQLRSRIQALWDANYLNTPLVKSLLANSLWLRDDINYNWDTLKKLAEDYHVSSYSGEMGSDEMNDLLRKWTDEHTGGLLSNYSKDMELDPETALAIGSTIYYKAAWVDQFQKERTNTEVFHGTSSDQLAAMMHMDSKMSFYQTEQARAVALRLNDNGTMYFILPEEGIDVKEIATAPDTIQLIRNSREAVVSHPLVHLAVPKFKVAEKTDLLDYLESVEITDAMNRNISDFTPLTNEVKKLWLSNAEHAAVLEIDEEGVTGAAYTELMIVATGMSQAQEEVDFVLDRPFCFAVTGGDDSILFAGIVQTIE